MISQLRTAYTWLRLGVITALFLGAVLIPTEVRAEFIRFFDSDILLSPNGALTVTETIEYVFTEPRHGIYREIPLMHPEPASGPFYERVIEVALDSVLLQGAAVPYELESSNDTFKVRIGDPDTTIDGVQVYTLVYRVAGGLSYPPQAGTELYFNVTGNGWNVPIQTARATVRGETAGLMRSERACYRGATGATASCLMSVDDAGVVRFETSDLAPGEGMTIAQALDPVAIPRDVRERLAIEWLFPLIVLLSLLVGGWKVYQYKTAHKTGRTIIAEYEPYPGVKPMYAGMLMDRRLDSRDITAGLIYLAQQGYVRIERLEEKVLWVFTTQDYRITLLRSIGSIKDTFEGELLIMLFDVEDAPPGTAITLGDLKNNLDEIRENEAIIRALKARLDQDLRAQGFVSDVSFTHLIKPATLIAIGIVLLVIWALSSVAGILFCIGTIILIVLVADGRRTRKGYEALDHLKGFKEFLRVTETERYAFHNAPKLSPEQFMEYLPFAIAFGVEKEWAEAFKNIAVSEPAWYDGGGHAFSPGDLTTSLNAFSTALAQGNNTAASSGGGSSGGGSGGGGGGSW
jgi:hypothetical protein